jgi:LPXTG-motif cell wall-anchored protein
MKPLTIARMAVIALIVAPVAGLAFAQAASATWPKPTYSACAVEADSAYTKPSPCPSASASASPSKSASVSPSASVSKSPSASTSPSGTVQASPTPSAASLPVTGTSGTIALVGLAAVIVGAVAIVVSRRRRKVQFAAE